MDLYEQPLHRHDFRAMGSAISVWLRLDDAALAVDLLRQAQNFFAAVETRMTRFDPASELSQLNRHSGRWSPLSRPLWQVIQRALELAKATDGLFDPTTLTAVVAAGYDRTFAAVQRTRSEHSATAEASTGCWDAVLCDPERHALYLPAGIGLDLGGIAKGFTAEQVVNFLCQWGPCLVDAGGDLTAGDGPPGYPGWPVAIAMPTATEMTDEDESPTALTLWLNNATLATSGTDYRWWLQAGQRLHHLIDPRTGRPAESDIVTASVLCADACCAEAWATATLVAGVTDGMARLATRQLAGAVIDQNQQIHLSAAMHRYVAADDIAIQ